jgi:U3 small nucleolar RNA-associated protein 7
MSSSKKLKREVPVDVDKATLDKFTRGSLKINTEKIKYKGLRLTLEQEQENTIRAAEQTAATQVLLPSGPGYIAVENDQSTAPISSFHKLKQSEIVQHVDINTSKNKFDLQLHEFGPYNFDYTRNGRYGYYSSDR